MKTNSILIKEGKAFAVCEEIPKEPENVCRQCDGKGWITGIERPCGSCNPGGEWRSSKTAYQKYHDSLQRVKDNATEFKDQFTICILLHASLKIEHTGKSVYEEMKEHFKEGEFYPLSVEVEIIEACAYDCCPYNAGCQFCREPKKLASIVEEPEEKQCPNCKETVEICACMRNICHKCGSPVGNITFTVCDDCWDEKKKDSEVEDQEYQIWMEHGAIHLGLSLEAAVNKEADVSRYVFNKLKEAGFSITRIKQ